MLDGIFPFHRFFLRLVFLIVDEFNRTPGFSIFGAFSVIMRLNPLSISFVHPVYRLLSLHLSIYV